MVLWNGENCCGKCSCSEAFVWEREWDYCEGMRTIETVSVPKSFTHVYCLESVFILNTQTRTSTNNPSASYMGQESPPTPVKVCRSVEHISMRHRLRHLTTRLYIARVLGKPWVNAKPISNNTRACVYYKYTSQSVFIYTFLALFLYSQRSAEDLSGQIYLLFVCLAS